MNKFLTKQIIEDLKKVENEYHQKINRMRNELEKEMAKEMADSLRSVLDEHQIFLALFSEGSEGAESISDEDYIEYMEEVLGETFYKIGKCDIKSRTKEHAQYIANMFVNNTITKTSIENDPSCDWDGTVRYSPLHEQGVMPLKALDHFDFEKCEFTSKDF